MFKISNVLYTIESTHHRLIKEYGMMVHSDEEPELCNFVTHNDTFVNITIVHPERDDFIITVLDSDNTYVLQNHETNFEGILNIVETISRGNLPYMN